MADEEIFDLDRTRDRSLLGGAGTARTDGLDGLVGRPRGARAGARPAHDVSALVALVDAAAADRAPLPAAEAAAFPRRMPRRIDWLSVTAAGLAVVAVVVASSFTAVQLANASPVGDAAALLSSDEESLSSAELGLTAARQRVSDQIAEGQTTVQGFQSLLLALAPGEDEDAIVDQAAIDAAAAVVAQYSAALTAIPLPDALPAWSAPDVDRESLASVATALDDVQVRAALVDDSTAEVRTARQAAESAAAAFTAGVDTFRSAAVVGAAEELENAPGAAQEARDAVTATAAAAAGADLTSAEGAASLVAYRDAVRELRVAQLRAEEEERERERERQRTQTSTRDSTGTQTPAPTDPGTGTTDPGTTTPPSEEPAPGSGDGDGTGG